MEEELVDALSYSTVYDEEIEKNLEKEYSRLKDQTYLDHAGATLYSESQIKNVMGELASSLFANPHSIGIASQMTQDIIDNARYKILNHFHVSSEEYSVIFTSGATSSIKIIAESFIFSFPKDSINSSKSSGCFVYLQDNHTSVLGMREIVSNRGAQVLCLDHNCSFEIFNSPEIKVRSNNEKQSNSLFVYSAQCNFTGLKYPLDWVNKVHASSLSEFTGDTTTRWYVLLDAAAFVSTNDLDLSVYKPDFVCFSFYKIFGYPTGIGALLVKNSSGNVLQKTYYGGGTVDVALSSQMFHVKKKLLHQKFEDGTVSFLSIASLSFGFDIISKITLSKISNHVFCLAKFLYYSLLSLHHENGQPVVKLYNDTTYENLNWQGGIVSFNLMRSNGEYIGYTEVVNMASLFNIHLRAGCFCNPGACQRHLSLSNDDILENYNAGYVCGGTTDLINGKPTGAIRISIGLMSSKKDIDKFLDMIKSCFLQGFAVIKFPRLWEEHKTTLKRKYKEFMIKGDKNNTKPNDKDENINNLVEIPSNRRIIRNFNCNNTGVLKRLSIYPIKSCGEYEIVGSWSLNSRGLQYDREWMIMTSTGVCLTQKHNINLCLINPSLCLEEKLMKLSYPGMPTIEVSLEYPMKDFSNGIMCQSRICGHKVKGIDCGADISEWLSLALGQANLRLIRQDYGDNEKSINIDCNNSNLMKFFFQTITELSFSAQAQYLIINETSLLWLADEVPDSSELNKNTILHRFRGNLVIEGFEAFDEFHWETIYIGDHTFTVNGYCTRCQMICHDQKTGKKTIEPLKTLAEKFNGKLRFGIYLTRQENTNGSLKIGDTIHIVK